MGQLHRVRAGAAYRLLGDERSQFCQRGRLPNAATHLQAGPRLHALNHAPAAVGVVARHPIQISKNFVN